MFFRLKPVFAEFCTVLESPHELPHLIEVTIFPASHIDLLLFGAQPSDLGSRINAAQESRGVAWGVRG